MTANYQAISRDAHATMGWKAWSSYSFAATLSIVPLVAAEMARAAMALPIAFVRQGEGYALHALTGLHPGQNLFITDQGQWVGSYVPAALRGYPFLLAKAGDDQRVLCVDEASGLLVADATPEQRFFDDQGEITPALAAIRDFLVEVDRNRLGTDAACATLAELNLIEPWPIKLRMGDRDTNLEGLHRINEAALATVEDEGFLRLRRLGALPVVYMQLLSMAHLPLLGRLSDAHAKRKKQMAEIMAETFLTPASGDIQLNFD